MRAFRQRRAVKSGEPQDLGASKKHRAKLPEKVQDLTRYFDQANLTEAQTEAISLRLEFNLIA